MKVLVLGGTGMLGSMVAKVLPDEWEVLVTYRTGVPFPYEPVNGRWVPLDVGAEGWMQTVDGYARECDWIINCIGATKPLLPDESVESTILATNTNIVLPLMLSSMKGSHVIQIATDCVFSGTAGPYDETCPADARDLYGSTKALGEVPGILHLRCSIVGPEVRHPARYLLGKVVSGEITKGYMNHYWNGVTTLAFAKVCVGIMSSQHVAQMASARKQAHHLIPANSLSKAELIDVIVSEFEVGPITWVKDPSVEKIDRRLSTLAPDMNEALWRAAGYGGVPTIDRLIEELADFCHREMWPQPGVEGWRYWRQ